MGRPTLLLPLQTAPSREQLVDEFGELDRQIQILTPKIKRHEALKLQIRGWYQDLPADVPAIATGSIYEVQVSARGQERSFTLKAKIKIFAKLGKARAMELFSITLKAVEDAFGKDELELLASKANTGSRKLVPVLKSSIQAEQAA